MVMALHHFSSAGVSRPRWFAECLCCELIEFLSEKPPPSETNGCFAGPAPSATVPHESARNAQAGTTSSKRARSMVRRPEGCSLRRSAGREPKTKSLVSYRTCAWTVCEVAPSMPTIERCNSASSRARVWGEQPCKGLFSSMRCRPSQARANEGARGRGAARAGGRASPLRRSSQFESGSHE